MATTFLIEDIAEEIISEAELTDVTVLHVASWIRGNVGRLNILLSASYDLENDEFTPAIGHDVKDIIKCMYSVRYLKNVAKNYLSQTTSNPVSIRDDVSQITFANINEIAKNARQMYKDEQEKLDEMIRWYHLSYALPQTYVCPSLCFQIAPNFYETGNT